MCWYNMMLWYKCTFFWVEGVKFVLVCTWMRPLFDTLVDFLENYVCLIFFGGGGPEWFLYVG